MLNAIPLVLHDYQQGNHPTVVVSEPWSGLLDGISYADKLIWNGPYHAPLTAKQWASGFGRFDKFYVPQCYGQSFKQQCSSFCEEAWRLVGMDHLWGKLPLVFDKRNHDREQALIPHFRKPMVLVNSDGISSAFSGRDELLRILKPLRDMYEIVDLSLVKAHRFYDLLGLYEKAEYLVCIDSGPLHLAQAVPSLKVIALITDSPNLWHGSPPRKNHVLRIRYNEFTSRKHEIVDALRLKKKAEPKMIHVWSKYNIVKMDAAKRHRMARVTWEKEMQGWTDLGLEETAFHRTSQTDYYEVKRVPYVTDMVDRAADHANDWDIIVLTNDDTCVAPNLDKTLKQVISECGACWSARREHRVINHVMTQDEIMRGYKHVGADLFAFTKEWWLDHGHQMPDMFMAFENWDYVMRTVIEEHGGKEIEGLCYHEIHQGDWLKNRESPAAKHNQSMGGQFFEARK